VILQVGMRVIVKSSTSGHVGTEPCVCVSECEGHYEFGGGGRVGQCWWRVLGLGVCVQVSMSDTMGVREVGEWVSVGFGGQGIALAEGASLEEHSMHCVRCLRT
jgi:hypothetical protein